MNTNNLNHEQIQEQISAFADGELTDSQRDMLLTALRATENRATWDVFHQIGDTLRSEDMAFEMRPDFMARLSKRLEEEPTVLAPEIFHKKAVQAAQTTSSEQSGNVVQRLWVKGATATAASAAVAALLLVATPQLMVASKDSSAPNPINVTAPAMAMLAASTPNSTPNNMRVVNQVDGVVLRDPGIDEYLLAHQRFSSSVYSNAQYARSATFAVDSKK